MKSKDKLKEENKVLITGIITNELPEMFYTVDAVFKHTDKNGKDLEIPLTLKCGVSGKMKKMLIQLRKGDEVDVEVSLYNLSVGTITYRKSKRKIENIL